MLPPLSGLILLMMYVSFSYCKGKNVVVLYVENINEVMAFLRDGNPLKIPSIRKLYNESVKFHNLYGEVASPSNFAAFMTGKPAVDLGIIRGKILPFDYFPSIASTGGLKMEEVTLAEALKEHRYFTWFSGYWKLGLGLKGDGYPTKHGFDTWMGIAHPHDEWCQRKPRDSVLEKIHPYMNLLYKISFLWSIIFLLLITMVWVKLISVRLFLNLMIYTFTTSFAFYILLHAFMIQRSASCVLYYHDTIYEQPYEVRNLTLHFTQHSTKLIDITAGMTSPFFMVLNYVKMRMPYFHSNFFRTKFTNTWSNSIRELDWSVGKVVEKLKETGTYNDTVIIMTGNNKCQLSLSNTDLLAYERYQKNDFRKVKVPANTLSSDCLKVPLFIKDGNGNEESTIFTYDVYEHVSITDIFDTILDISRCYPPQSYPSSLVKLFKKFCVDPKLRYGELMMSKTALSAFHNDSSDGSLEDVKSNQMEWYVEVEDEDVMIEGYMNSDDVPVVLRVKETPYVPHHYLYHYYNVQKPMAVTYEGQYQIIYGYYYGDGFYQKLDSPILVDMQHRNISQESLEHIYQNISLALKNHLRERQNKNTYSSEFEMPVYPWLLPCANFPRCETVGDPSINQFDIIPSFYDDG